MTQIFESHSQAMQAAEKLSKGTSNNAWVIKQNIGGLRYAVTSTKPEPPQGKILNHYEKGNKLK